MKIKLQYPLSIKTTFGLKTILIETVTLRRPRMKDLEDVNLQAPPEKLAQELAVFISRLSNLPLESVRELDLVDYMKIQAEVTVMTQVKSNG